MKKDLQAAAGLTHYTMNKLSRDEDVTTETLRKMCTASGCSFDDIMEIIPDTTMEQFYQNKVGLPLVRKGIMELL